MNKIRAAAIQISSGPDKKSNLKKATRLVTRAAAKGAQLVALPELFNWRGPGKEIPHNAETIPGLTSATMSELAASHSLFILCGSILEVNPRSSKPFNTSLLICPDGTICARYRKIHLFSLREKTGTASIDETAHYSAGRYLRTALTPFGRVGLSICFDLRFPELYRTLADRGSVIIFVPSAFTHETGKAHWETLLRARAIENQVYIVAPNQHGAGPLGTRNYGHSLIVDPWGSVVARAQKGDRIIHAELAIGHLSAVRKKIPIIRTGKII